MLLKRHPLLLLMLPFWWLKGRPAFRQQVADRVDLDVTRLPFHQPLLDVLRVQHSQGRRLILVTDANLMTYAEQIARYLGIFESILACDQDADLSGKPTSERLVSTFGAGGFDYVGHAATDLHVWRYARAAIVVNARSALVRRVAAPTSVEQVFTPIPIGIWAFLNAIRLHQWAKNALVFVPLAAAHQMLNPLLLAQAGIAFLAFGCFASSVYVLNDLFDLAADRQHPTKCRRAFAAGIIPVQHGLMLIPVLLVPGFLLALLLPYWFGTSLGLYYVLTLAYSLRLKQLVLVDVLTLAGLYTLRIIAGGAATDIPLSFWLLAFSMFLFLSLALVKRTSELLVCRDAARDAAAGRDYRTTDLETLAQFGVTSGYLAVLVLALYIDSPSVVTLYSEPWMLWLLCPVLLYWISRVWLLTRRGELHEDPMVFALTDRTSYGLFALVAGILWRAS